MDLVVCQQTYTKLQLKGLYQEIINKQFVAEIEDIVSKVVHKAKIQDTDTSYKHIYRFAEHYNEILNKKTDQEIIEHLHAILVDADITIIQIKCAYFYSNNGICKEIIINW
jgi:predicted neutral ceramidase superfamily lipid hydrolase